MPVYRWGVPYLNRVVRKGLTKVTFEKRSERGKGMTQMHI